MDNLQKSELVIATILEVLASNGLQPIKLGFLDLSLDDEFRVFLTVQLCGW